MTAILAFFLSPIGRYVGGALIVLLAVGAIYLKGHSNGYASCKSDWQAAEQRTIEKGANARRDAERDVTNGVSDGFNRDKR